MRIFTFEVVECAWMIDGYTEYRPEEHAFAFRSTDLYKEIDCKGKDEFASICLDNLQIEVAIRSQLCLYVFGYSPLAAWSIQPVEAPTSSKGCLRIISSSLMERGVAYRLSESPLQKHVDPNTGWFCIRQELSTFPSENVEFASNIIAAIAGNSLTALWIRPRNWNELRAYLQNTAE